MTKHIFFIVNTYVFPLSAGTSGGQKHVIELLKRLNENGFTYTIITPQIGQRYFESFGIKGDFLTTSSIDNRYGVPFAFLYNMLKSLAITLRLPKNCVVYSEADAFPNIFPAFLSKARHRGIFWITAFHLIASNPVQNFKEERKNKHLIRGSLLFISQQLSIALIKLGINMIVTGDSKTKSSLEQLGIHKQKITQIKMGADISKISAIKSDTKIYDACFIGRFHPQKGIFDLIEIWDNVCTVRGQSKLVIIGAGDLFIEKKIKDAIESRENLRDNVTLVGFKFGEEYYRIIKASKVLLFPSKREGNPIVPLDAMACGVPVIAYNLSVFKEMYDRGIITIPMDNTKQFAAKAYGLLTNSEALKKLSDDAYSMASCFDWDVTIEELIKHIRESYIR